MSKFNYIERTNQEFEELRDNLKRNANVTLSCLYEREKKTVILLVKLFMIAGGIKIK